MHTNTSINTHTRTRRLSGTHIARRSNMRTHAHTRTLALTLRQHARTAKYIWLRMKYFSCSWHSFNHWGETQEFKSNTARTARTQHAQQANIPRAARTQHRHNTQARTHKTHARTARTRAAHTQNKAHTQTHKARKQQAHNRHAKRTQRAKQAHSAHNTHGPRAACTRKRTTREHARTALTYAQQHARARHLKNAP